jgi:cobalt-zinc-cadmium efflux system protein
VSAFIFDSGKVDGVTMMLIATIALIGNGISAYLLFSLRDGEDDINIQSAYLHFLADSLLSLGVVLGGLAIYLFGIYLIDKVLGILFAVYIIYATFPLLRRSFYSLMDIEHKINIEEVEKIILSVDGVRSLHDVHIIEPSPKHSFFYGHIVLDKNLTVSEIDLLISKIEKLVEQFGINHSVIQPESPQNSDEPLLKQSY